MNMNMMNNNLTINNNSNNIGMDMMQLNMCNMMMFQNMMNSYQIIPQSNNQQMQEILDGNENSDKDYLYLRFIKIGDGRNDKIYIQCSYNEKVSDVIERYRQKSGDYSSTKFYFNSKKLFSNLTVLEAGLNNYAVIYAQTTGNISGGDYSMIFTDLSKNKTSEIRCSKTAPSYRKIIKGINIFGICNFKKCKAYKKEVVSNVKKKKLDLIKERDELFCPECEATIIPKTVGFYLCKFLIYGKKLENGKEKSFRNKEDEANKVESMKYFDPGLNGEVMVTELVFEVLEYL